MRSAHPVLIAKQSTPYPYTASNDHVAVATLTVSSGAYITPLLEDPLQTSTSNRAMAGIHAPFHPRYGTHRTLTHRTIIKGQNHIGHWDKGLSLIQNLH